MFNTPEDREDRWALSVVARLLMTDMPDKEKVAEFVRRTGRSRATYFRYKRAVAVGQEAQRRDGGETVEEYMRRTGKSRASYYRQKQRLSARSS